MGHYECRRCDQRYDNCTCRSDFNPDHDSLFMRFEQLETLLDGILHSRPTAQEALALVRLIRKQVLK